MHENARLIDSFYKAFAARDAKTMGESYHPAARFSDPVFPDLEGWQAAAMWKMFCEGGSGLSVEHSGVDADATMGRAHWDARYTFSATGRSVLNRIDATFEMKDGKIFRHRDSFPFWKWTRMALGPAGIFLGWTPMVQGKIRKQARKALDGFIKLEGLQPPERPG